MRPRKIATAVVLLLGTLTGQRPNPTAEPLVRYAEAVGTRLVVSLTDA